MVTLSCQLSTSARPGSGSCTHSCHNSLALAADWQKLPQQDCPSSPKTSGLQSSSSGVPHTVHLGARGSLTPCLRFSSLPPYH